MQAAPVKFLKTKHLILFAASMTALTFSYACTERGRDGADKRATTPDPTPAQTPIELFNLMLPFRGDEPPIIISGGSVEVDIDLYEYEPVAAPSPAVKFTTSRNTQLDAVAVFNDEDGGETPAFCAPLPDAPRILKITYQRGITGPTSEMTVRDKTEGCPTGITRCVTVEFNGDVLMPRARMRRRRFNQRFRIKKVEFVNGANVNVKTCYEAPLLSSERRTVAVYNAVRP